MQLDSIMNVTEGMLTKTIQLSLVQRRFHHAVRFLYFTSWSALLITKRSYDGKDTVNTKLSEADKAWLLINYSATFGDRGVEGAYATLGISVPDVVKHDTASARRIHYAGLLPPIDKGKQTHCVLF